MMDLSDKVFFILCSTVLIAILVLIPFFNQRAVKVTCGVDISIKDALFYDLKAASCPTVVVKNK